MSAWLGVRFTDGRLWASKTPVAPHFNAATKINLGSATVPVIPPVETSNIPKTLLALFVSMTLNCSTNSIFDSSQLCLRISHASLERFIFGRKEGLTFDR